MSLRIRHLLLRSKTDRSFIGAEISFSNGLVLVRAENSMGKSTCFLAIIYALGLERMLGASTEIPLPHVMTQYVEEGDVVTESEVVLEIENGRGQFITIRRAAAGPSN